MRELDENGVFVFCIVNKIRSRRVRCRHIYFDKSHVSGATVSDESAARVQIWMQDEEDK